MKLNRDLREFIELLRSEAVDYVVVGGHAVAFHGYPRYTGDIDFLVGTGEGNAAKLERVLARFGFASTGLSAKDFRAPGQVVQLGRPPNRIDLVTSISGVSFEEALASRVVGTLDGLEVPFIGREALLANKRASGRAKDLADVEALEPRSS